MSVQDHASETLGHHGIKGMHWGVRKAPETTGARLGPGQVRPEVHPGDRDNDQDHGRIPEGR